MDQALGSGLVDGLDSHLVGGLSLSPGALGRGGVKLLQLGLQRRLGSAVLSGLGVDDQNALLGGLDIRQTKHLLILNFHGAGP